MMAADELAAESLTIKVSGYDTEILFSAGSNFSQIRISSIQF